MIDCLSYAFDPRQFVVGSWWSTVDTGAELAAGHIADTYTAYIEELTRIGQASAAVPAQSNASLPFSSRMRPVFNTTRLMAAEKVYVRKISYYAYDVTLAAETIGIQDDATNTAITDSASSDNDAYVQSKFRFSLISGFAPNLFRPSFRYNSNELFDSLQSPAMGANRGDMSLGLPIPYCLDFDPPLVLGKVNRLDLAAPCGQYIDSTGKWQFYAVQCVVEFYIV